MGKASFGHEVVNLSASKRDTTIVEVNALDCGYDDNEILLTDAIAKLQDALNSIPAEYRSVAVLKIKAYGDYASAHTEIEYKRPETDAEMANRLGWLKSLRDADEERDRANYERLRHKYARQPE